MTNPDHTCERCKRMRWLCGCGASGETLDEFVKHLEDNPGIQHAKMHNELHQD